MKKITSIILSFIYIFVLIVPSNGIADQKSGFNAYYFENNNEEQLNNETSENDSTAQPGTTFDVAQNSNSESDISNNESEAEEIETDSESNNPVPQTNNNQEEQNLTQEESDNTEEENADVDTQQDTNPSEENNDSEDVVDSDVENQDLDAEESEEDVIVELISASGLSNDAELEFIWYDKENGLEDEIRKLTQAANCAKLNNVFELNLLSGSIANEDDGVEIVLSNFVPNKGDVLYHFTNDSFETLDYHFDENNKIVTFITKSFSPFAFGENIVDPEQTDNNEESEDSQDPEVNTDPVEPEDEKLFESEAYKDSTILISNYSQLLLIGTDAVLTSTDHNEEELGLGDPVYSDEETQVIYSYTANYMLVSDIVLPEGGYWELSEKFKGTFESQEMKEGAPLYDEETDTIFIYNPYQMDLLKSEERETEPVMTGDATAAEFGIGKLIYPKGSDEPLTYSKKHNYVIASSFSPKKEGTRLANITKARNANTANYVDGRDYFGQASVEIDGTKYILIGDRQQLDAINDDSTIRTDVCGPVFKAVEGAVEVWRTDLHLTGDWIWLSEFDGSKDLKDGNGYGTTAEEVIASYQNLASGAVIIYPGDADLIDLGTDGDFSELPLYDNSPSSYHQLDRPGGTATSARSTREIYFTTNSSGEPDLTTATLIASDPNIGTLTYKKDGNYIVFRDIDMTRGAINGLNWKPLMFSGNMYGIKTENSNDVQTLWDSDHEEMNINTSMKPNIHDFSVLVENRVNLNQYTGVGFFGTLTGTFNDSALVGNRMVVKNIRLSDGSVENLATNTTVDQTVVNALLTGLGIVAGGLLDGLLYVLTGGKIVGVQDMLTGLLNTRAKDPSSMATGAFAGRIIGDTQVEDCEVENVSVTTVRTVFEENGKIVGKGGFVGWVEGETRYEGLSGLLGGLVDVLGGLLNVIPGLGLGDLINLLLENALDVGSLIPVGYTDPQITRCKVINTTLSTESGKIGVGGFAGSICGTEVHSCEVIDSNYTVKASKFGGGFCGVARDAIIKGTLSGLGVDIAAALHPQSEIINSQIDNSTYSVIGEDYLGGFIGIQSNSYAITDTITSSCNVTVDGSGNWIGGFTGYATMGTLFSLGDRIEMSGSLLGTVKGLVTGLLGNDSDQSLLDLGGVAAPGIMGCQIFAPVSVEGDGNYVGGLLGRGDGVYITDSSSENLMKLMKYKRNGSAPSVSNRSTKITKLQSVTSGNNYAGGIAGYLTTANVGGLLGDTLGIGQYLAFYVENVEVVGNGSGYTVTAGNNDAGGGYGFAIGGETRDVELRNVRTVTANNRAGGFVGTTGPGNLLGGDGLDLQLLGIHLLQIDSLLSVAEGVRTTYTRANVNGIDDGLQVSATGVNTNGGVTQFTAGGYAGFASSSIIDDCHAYNLLSVTANMTDAAAGGFVGHSQAGGLAGVIDEGETTLDAIKVGQLVDAVPYLIPYYDGCSVHYVNGGYVQANTAGGFTGDFQSGKVNTETSPAEYEEGYSYTNGISSEAYSVYNIAHVEGGTYGGGWGGKVYSGVLASAGGGLSVLGGVSNVNISANQILSVAEAYVPIIKYAGVNSTKGFDVFAAAATSEGSPSQEGYAGGYIGYGSGIQVSYSNVNKLKHGTVTPPSDLEEVSGSSYITYQKASIPYAVAGARYAGGYIGKMDIGDAASVGDGLSLLGNNLKLGNVLSALSVVISTIEHSNVYGAPGGYSVIASSHVALGDGSFDSNGIGHAGGFAGHISGGHIQDGNSYNFYYIIGEVSAGGYVGWMEPGDTANLLDDGSSLSFLGNVDSLASLVQDFVPTIRNSETTCVPCGGAVRAQCSSDSLKTRGTAGGYVGHAIGAQIWGNSTDAWKGESSYSGIRRECAAIRIRSVYGAEFAGGFCGLEECGSTASTGGLSLLGNLISASNILGALQCVYSTFRYCAVYGPLEKIDVATWNAWIRYIAAYGAFASEIAEIGEVSTQEELDEHLPDFIYGYHVVAGRTSFNQNPNLILSGVAGGFIGGMHSGVIRNSHGKDAKIVRAMRSAGGFVGEMQTKGLAEFGSANILSLPLNLGNLLSIGNVFVPAIYDSEIEGYKQGMTVEATGAKENECGCAGGFCGACYGGQMNNDKVKKLVKVFGRYCLGGYVGKVSSAAVLSADTERTTEGFLQKVLNNVISTPGNLADVLKISMSIIKNAEVSSMNGYGFIVDGEYKENNQTKYADYVGGFAGYLEAAVLGERSNANDKLIVNGLRGVNGGYYAGGFFGLADVSSVASVGGDDGQGNSTMILDVIQAGDISALDAFRTYIYHAEVRGVSDGITVRSHNYDTRGLMHTFQASGGAGGFGGGLMNGTVEHSVVRNLNLVEAPTHSGGFIGYMGKNGGVTVEEASVQNNNIIGTLLSGLGLNLGANAQLLNIVGSTATECDVYGYSKGATIRNTVAIAPESGVVDITSTKGSDAGGFTGFADISQVESCHVYSLRKVDSKQVAGGFVGRSSVAYILDTEVSSALTEILVKIVNALIRALYLDHLENVNLVDLDASLVGLKLLSDGDLLYVNLLGLKIGVSLSKNDPEYGGNSDAAIITIGSSTIKLPCDENGIVGETSNVSITLIEGNRTCIKHSSVTGIENGYDVFGGGATVNSDGADALGYAGGFVGVNDNGFMSHDEMILCDVVRGTENKVGAFVGFTKASSRPQSYLEGTDNHYSIYRVYDSASTGVYTDGGAAFAESIANEQHADIDYNRYRVLHYDVIESFGDLENAEERGSETRPLDAYASSAKAVLMLSYILNPLDDDNPGDTPEVDDLKDPCEETFDLDIHKKWKDAQFFFSTRPEYITVQIQKVAVGSTPPEQLIYTGDAPEGSNPVTTTITISSSDSSTWNTNWKATIDDLIVWEEIDGQPVYYAYYIKELPVSDYVTSYEIELSTGTVIIKNTLIKSVNMPVTGSNASVAMTCLGIFILASGIIVLTKKRKRSI